jgi:hypothetical protein
VVRWLVGTGAGKTESFLLLLLDHCRRHAGNPRVKAWLLYPRDATGASNNEQTLHRVTAGSFVAVLAIVTGCGCAGHVRRRVSGMDLTPRDRDVRFCLLGSIPGKLAVCDDRGRSGHQVVYRGGGGWYGCGRVL